MSLSKLIEEKRKEKARQVKKRDAKHIMTGLTFGVAIGTLSGILLSPKSGKENIENLKGKVNELGGKIKEKSNIAKGKLKDYLENKKISSEINCKIADEKEVEILEDDK